MLKTSYVRELEPFWRNLYAQYADFLNDNFIRSKVLTIDLFPKKILIAHQHVAYITEHNEAYL
jgi:hypothetical protein